MNMRTAQTRLRACCRVAAFALLATVSTAPAFASDPASMALPTWDRLSTTQREQLIAPVRERWNAEPPQRARMLRHAQRWQQMTPEQRRRAHHGMQRWEHMNPEQRQQTRALFEQMRGLPEDQRAALRQQWKRMTPEQRKAWVREHETQR